MVPQSSPDAKKIYLTKHSINQSVITPYCLQAKGRVKRLSGSMTKDLAKLTADNPRAWAQHLLTFLMIWQVHFNCSTVVRTYKAVFEFNLC